jgi:ribulose-5-phosphate 4-epimerase/fuculose-1-phosphate aldolase
MKVGHVPHISYHRPGAPQAVDEVGALVRRYGEAGTPIRAVMLNRLGPVVWHESPAAAMAVLEELEETARLTLLATVPLQPLDAAAIDELRAAFGARW